MKPTLLSLLVAVAVGCGGGGQNADPKQPQPAPVAEPAPAKPADPPPAPASTIANDDDYIAKASGLVSRMIDVFKADGKDCEKLADDLDKIATEAAQLKPYEKAHPDVAKKLEASLKNREQEMMSAMGPAIEACGNNEHMMKVMAKFN